MEGISPMLVVENMEKTLHFYEKKLGFTVGVTFPDRERAQYADVSRWGSVFMFQPLEGMNHDLKEKFHIRPETPKGKGSVFYVTIKDNIDEYYRNLQEKEVTIAQEIKDQPWGGRNFVIADPDGYLISFTQPMKDAKKCMSCGMPITDEINFCQHCTDEKGNLKPYEEVLAGMKGFMISQGIPPEEAEDKAKDHMSKMPAWGKK